jgi:hypothetical protein
MDTNLLRSWLGLPPGPWPPDDHTLLGLKPGGADPAEVERRALQLMGKLRSHQLVHPELVTEGMNRLAQAMLAVTLSAHSTPAVEVTDAVTELRPKGATPAAPQPAPAVLLEAVPLIEAQPVAVPDVVEIPSAPALPGLRPSPVAVPPPAVEGVPEVRVAATRVARRAAYRELAGLRALVRAWGRLRSSFGTPAEPLASAAEVFDLLEGIAHVRDATAHPGLRVTVVLDAAPRTAAILRQPLAVAVFRSLTPAQRQALAREWARAHSLFTGQAVRLREGLIRSRPRRPLVTRFGLESALARNPEWMLAAAMLAVFVVAAVRVVLR